MKCAISEKPRCPEPPAVWMTNEQFGFVVVTETKGTGSKGIRTTLTLCSRAGRARAVKATTRQHYSETRPTTKPSESKYAAQISLYGCHLLLGESERLSTRLQSRLQQGHGQPRGVKPIPRDA